MTFYRKSGGGNVAPTIIRRRSGGAWANVQTIKRRSGGTWVTMWTAYTPISNVQHADISVTKFGTAATGTVSAAVTDPTWDGGNPNPTISWQVMTGTAGYNPTTKQLSATGVADGQTVSGTIKVTVSDGVSSSSKTINYSLTYNQTA